MPPRPRFVNRPPPRTPARPAPETRTLRAVRVSSPPDPPARPPVRHPILRPMSRDHTAATSSRLPFDRIATRPRHDHRFRGATRAGAMRTRLEHSASRPVNRPVSGGMPTLSWACGPGRRRAHDRRITDARPPERFPLKSRGLDRVPPVGPDPCRPAPPKPWSGPTTGTPKITATARRKPLPSGREPRSGSSGPCLRRDRLPPEPRPSPAGFATRTKSLADQAQVSRPPARTRPSPRQPGRGSRRTGPSRSAGSSRMRTRSLGPPGPVGEGDRRSRRQR